LKAPAAADIAAYRGHLVEYIDVVIEQEWPAQQAGRLEEASPDATLSIGQHVPRQRSDFACSQPSLRRQQYDHTVSERISGPAGKEEELMNVER
jgi:hypothetical protein